VKSLIEVQLEVLFARNQRGRLMATRDPEARPAPRLFLGRSRERNVWAVRVDVDGPTKRTLDRCCSAEPTIDSPRADRIPTCRELVQQVLAPIESEWRGPAYVLPEELPCDARAREIAASETSGWREVFPWLVDHFDALAPVVIAFADGQPASVCRSPRGCTAVAAEAGVETLEPFRNRGLATAAVARWARAVQRTGRLALYSTSWENAASLSVARRLSARLYGENWHLR
jgi:hypothetical protein